MCKCFTCTYSMCVEEGFRPLKLECKLPSGCWVLNLGPQEEQLVLLIAKSSLQQPWVYVLKTLESKSISRLFSIVTIFFFK